MLGQGSREPIRADAKISFAVQRGPPRLARAVVQRDAAANASADHTEVPSWGHSTYALHLAWLAHLHFVDKGSVFSLIVILIHN